MTPSGNYISVNGSSSGPFTADQLKSMWRAGQITSETPYWFEGLSEWITLGAVVEDEIAADKSKAERDSRLAQYQKQIVPKPGWSPGYYAFLVLITLLLPIGGFVIGLAGVFDATKRKQAGQLMALSIAWGVLFSFAIAYLIGR